MRSLLIPLAFPLALIAGGAIACPGAGSKDAAAPADHKPVVAQKAAPTAKTPAAKATKVAAKATPAQRRTAG